MSLKFLHHDAAAAVYVDHSDLSYCDWKECTDTSKTAVRVALVPTCAPGTHEQGYYHLACYEAYCDYEADRSFR